MKKLVVSNLGFLGLIVGLGLLNGLLLVAPKQAVAEQAQTWSGVCENGERVDCFECSGLCWKCGASC
jgi:hypothetical protein